MRCRAGWRAFLNTSLSQHRWNSIHIIEAYAQPLQTHRLEFNKFPMKNGFQLGADTECVVFGNIWPTIRNSPQRWQDRIERLWDCISWDQIVPRMTFRNILLGLKSTQVGITKLEHRLKLRTTNHILKSAKNASKTILSFANQRKNLFTCYLNFLLINLDLNSS